jgi:hypothetical protein
MTTPTRPDQRRADHAHASRLLTRLETIIDDISEHAASAYAVQRLHSYKQEIAEIMQNLRRWLTDETPQP